MKCPKCGNEIKEGYLYCDVCGEEIRIVPDFDETVDDTIKLSLTDVIDTAGVEEGLKAQKTKDIKKDIGNQTTKEINVDKNDLEIEILGQKDSSEEKTGNNHIVKALVIAGALCAVIIVVFCISYINKKINNYYSKDTQYELAFEQYEEGKYEDSIKTVRHCISIDAEDARFPLLLADNYNMLSKFDESNAVLFDLLKKYPSDISIYEKIIKNYKEQNDYISINKLLNECEDSFIRDNYSEYFAKDVEFSIEEGVYDEMQTLALSGAEGSTIYYTLDGSEATEDSNVYTEPIPLENGEYVINAISVSSLGITSNNVSKTYEIDFYKPDAPVFKTGSGEYNTPKLVEVDFADYDVCYYTIDGDDPTVEDNRYVGPIAMYIGSHTYKFAVISSKGVSSDVVSLKINLDLITLVEMGIAKGNLTSWIQTTGKNVDDYIYKCEQGYEYNKTSYYIINEYQKDDEGVEKQTGNHYAVDVLTGMTYRAVLNSSTGEYTLEALI